MTMLARVGSVRLVDCFVAFTPRNDEGGGRAARAGARA
jgi:hypothetical protein